MDDRAACPLAEDDRPSPNLHEPKEGFGSAASIFQPTIWPQSHVRVNISLRKSKMTASNAVVRARLNTRPALGLKANTRQLGRANGLWVFISIFERLDLLLLRNGNERALDLFL